MSPKPLHLAEHVVDPFGPADALGATAAHRFDTAELGIPPRADAGGAPPVAVHRTQVLRLGAHHCMWHRELAPILARLLVAPTKAGSTAVHVTAVASGDGASTVARQIAHAAARHPWCKALLLDANPGRGDQGACLGGVLPNLLESFAARNVLEVAVVKAADATFHAASMPPVSSSDEMRAIAGLRAALAAEYNLVVLDCPPVLDEAYFAPVSAEVARVVLVLRAGRTRMSLALRARHEIEGLGAELFGAVLTQQRRFIPRMLERLL